MGDIDVGDVGSQLTGNWLDAGAGSGHEGVCDEASKLWWLAVVVEKFGMGLIFREAF